MKIVLFRANNLFASRVNKYVSFFEEKQFDYSIYGWNRSGETIKKDHYMFFDYQSGTAVGGMRALKNHLLWMIYVFRSLFRLDAPEIVVHACDLNSAFPSVLFKQISKKKVRVIFDVCDWFSANFSTNKLICFVLELLEHYTIKHVDEVIICDHERIEQIPYKLKKKELVLLNIPNVEKLELDLKIEEKYQFSNDKITISYFGGFTNSRCLEPMLILAEQGLFNLLIAGYGETEIEDKCLSLSKVCDNVKYVGKVSVEEGLLLMYNSDLIYAMYSKKVKNHIYAAPNKFYESLFLGKPILSTKGIRLEKKILNNDVGYVIEEDVCDLKKFIESTTKEDLVLKGRNAKELWNNKYSRYISNFMENEYSKLFF